MKFIKFVILLFVVFYSCSNRKTNELEMFPAYKLIKTFSKRIRPETDLVLYCYGVNYGLPKDYQYKNSVANFTTDYKLYKTQKDTISREHARELIVSLAESLLQEINSNPEVRPDLEVYPFTNELLSVTIYFIDENEIELGTGISSVHFRNGKLKYEHYEIYEYTGRYPANGNHYKVHEETYVEALDIVQKQGALVYF